MINERGYSMETTFFGVSRFKQFSPYGSKISNHQKRLFIAFSLYPLSFFANTPFKMIWKLKWDTNFVDVLIYPTAHEVHKKRF